MFTICADGHRVALSRTQAQDPETKHDTIVRSRTHTRILDQIIQQTRPQDITDLSRRARTAYLLAESGAQFGQAVSRFPSMRQYTYKLKRAEHPVLHFIPMM